MIDQEDLEKQAAFAIYNYLGPNIEPDRVDWLWSALKAFFAGKPCPVYGETSDECVSNRESTEQENTGDGEAVERGAA